MSDFLPRVAAITPLSILLAAGYLAGRDASSLSFESLSIFFGCLATALLALSLVDAACRALSRKRSGAEARQTWAWALVGPAVLILLPLGLGLWRAWQLASSAPSWLVPALLVAAALLVGLAWLGSRVRRLRTLASGPAQALYASFLSAGFLALHHVLGTLTGVREGTILLHLGLFMATWFASAGLALPLASRATPQQGGAAFGVQVALAVVGCLFLEIDRRVLVGLYEAVHVWLLILGVVCLEGALNALLSRLLERAARRLPPSGALVAWLLLVIVIGATAARWQRLQSADVRAELAASSGGASLLELLPSGSSAGALAEGTNPALLFPRYLDQPWQGKELNLLLITIDTLRADQLDPDRGAETAAPTLRALAQRGVQFSRAYAQGTRTAVAMGALMTGRYSANIDWQLWAYKKGKLFDPKDPAFTKVSARGVFTTMPRRPKAGMLAERLKRAGYVTLATAYAGRNEFFAKGNGFDRGFSRFSDFTKKQWRAPTSDRLVKSAIRQLRANHERGKWFQWVHLYDPHESKGDQERYHELVKLTDSALARLLEELDTLGVADNTAIFVLADHGEAFGEHRSGSHGTSLYDEQARVPLIAFIPGMTPRVEHQPVAALDVTATLLSLANANTSDVDGVNLLPLLQKGEYPASRPVFLEIHRFNAPGAGRSVDMKGLVLDQYKLVVDRRKNTAALFNLETDPGEKQNLVAKAPAEYRRLNSLLNNFIQTAEAAHPLPE